MSQFSPERAMVFPRSKSQTNLDNAFLSTGQMEKVYRSSVMQGEDSIASPGCCQKNGLWGGALFLAAAVLLFKPGLVESTTRQEQLLSGGNKAGSQQGQSVHWQGIPEQLRERNGWSFAFGWGVVGDTTPGECLALEFDRFNGPGEGFTYNFVLSYQLFEADWLIGGLRLRPVIEVPVMLTLVDQNGGEVVPDINLGLLFRWRDFPWHRYLYTTWGIGGGFSYAFDDWEADRAQHGGENRSNLKFWLDVEFTIALPSIPENQIFLFIDHQSGGHIFEVGGVDAWGLGYRYLF